MIGSQIILLQEAAKSEQLCGPPTSIDCGSYTGVLGTLTLVLVIVTVTTLIELLRHWLRNW